MTVSCRIRKTTAATVVSDSRPDVPVTSSQTGARFAALDALEAEFS